MATVSVIIPSYNRAAWLPATVHSVLRQTAPPLEVLIVDDGSTDDTAQVCAGFPPPVRYLRQENAGVSAARNRGIREARGDYIALADSDDLWTPEKLDLQLRAQEITGAVWSATGVSVIDPEGGMLAADGLANVFALFHAFRIEPDEFLRRWFTSHELMVGDTRHTIYAGDAFTPLFFGNFIAPSAVMFAREVFEHVGLFDEDLRLAEETEFFHRTAAQFELAFIRSPLTRYRAGHPGSLISGKNAIALVENALESINRAVELRAPVAPAVREAHRAGRKVLTMRLAYAYLTALRPADSRRALLQARKQGDRISARWLGLFAAALLPPAALRVLHTLKRTLRS